MTTMSKVRLSALKHSPGHVKLSIGEFLASGDAVQSSKTRKQRSRAVMFSPYNFVRMGLSTLIVTLIMMLLCLAFTKNKSDHGGVKQHYSTQSRRRRLKWALNIVLIYNALCGPNRFENWKCVSRTGKKIDVPATLAIESSLTDFDRAQDVLRKMLAEINDGQTVDKLIEPVNGYRYTKESAIAAATELREAHKKAMEKAARERKLGRECDICDKKPDEFGIHKELRASDTAWVQLVRHKGKDYIFKEFRKKEAYQMKEEIKIYKEAAEHENGKFFVELKGVVDTDGQKILVFPRYVGSLCEQSDLIKSLTTNEITILLAQVYLSVHRFHDLNYVHNDIKPDQILMKKDGNIVLGDPGLAIEIGTKRDWTHANLWYPEFYDNDDTRARAHYKSDIYATGMTMLWILGANAQKGLTGEHLDKIHTELKNLKNDMHGGYIWNTESNVIKMVSKHVPDNFSQKTRFAKLIAGLLGPKREENWDSFQEEFNDIVLYESSLKPRGGPAFVQNVDDGTKKIKRELNYDDDDVPREAKYVYANMEIVSLGEYKE